jgi:hypothetical protein
MFPLFRRLPKYGFSNVQFQTVYQVVNVADLESRFDDGGHVTAAALEESGLVRDRAGLVKILGDGELKKKLTVEAHRFSASAVAKIEGSGGSVKRLGPQPKKRFVKRFVKRVAEPAETSAKKGKGSAGKASAGKALAEKALAGKALADKGPAGKGPADRGSAGKASAGESSGGKTSAGESSAGKGSAGKPVE